MNFQKGYFRKGGWNFISSNSPLIKNSQIGKIGILMRVRWGTTAEETEGRGGGGGDLMPGTWRDEDGIARMDKLGFAIDLHVTAAFDDVIKLLAELMVVAFGGLAGRNAGFSKRLIPHGSVGEI